jgi:hypothetical protein
MNKIYGYDDEMMISFINFMKGKQGGNLSALFKEFAKMNDRASGTIRNLYYAISKRAESDEDFRNKYLDGVGFSTGKIERFDPDGEREILKKIMAERLACRSTRSAVMRLANGDGKTALRYQNKYRSALKKNRAQIEEIAEELSKERGGIEYPLKKVSSVTEYNINKVKGEINALVERIAFSKRQENENLKREIALLKEENEALKLKLESQGIKALQTVSKTLS